MVREVGPTILNRPPGTVPVSPEDQAFDYEQVHEDIAALTEKYQGFVEQLGETEGSIQFARWCKRGRKRMEEG